MIRNNRGDFYAITIGVALMAALMDVVCWLFWRATEGLPNAYDNDPGLPLIIDIILWGSIILTNLMAIVIPWRLRGFLDKKALKSTWFDDDDNFRTNTPGPPISTKR